MYGVCCLLVDLLDKQVALIFQLSYSGSHIITSLSYQLFCFYRSWESEREKETEEKNFEKEELNKCLGENK